MSEQCETHNRSLPATTRHRPHRPEQFSSSTTPAPKDKRVKKSSTSSNVTATVTRSRSSRRRAGESKALGIQSKTGSSLFAQRSASSLGDMSSVNFTKTGRVSKAKKGLKVHDCECGRSYTRAEHLRRHQRNHVQEGAMVCKYLDCGKSFYRSDLLQRHEERHSELNFTPSRQQSISSSGQSAHPSPMTVPASFPTVTANTLPSNSYTCQPAISPQREVLAYSRYNPNQFRTPQLPRTPKAAPSMTSNHFFQSISFLKTPPKLSGSTNAQNTAYPTRHSISGPVPVEGTATIGSWAPEPFAPSPYSCSSDYASPVPCPEYGHVYATPPYGSSIVRTRASSNASLVDQSWAQSPTSSISMPSFFWAAETKSTMTPAFPYPPVSCTTTQMPIQTNIGSMGNYRQYDTRDFVQMDSEEAAQLFPEENYGMSQLARADFFEHWLNNYWRLFHPTFPIIHRFTFSRISASPLLCAAMAAIGAFYSNDSKHAIELHDRCLEALTKRQEAEKILADRLCDLQAIFLVEAFALRFAMRCARTLSTRFLAMVKQLGGITGAAPSLITDPILIKSTSEDDLKARWFQWVRLSVRQRLLTSCYLMKWRHLPVLDHKSLSVQRSGYSLPFPSHNTLWEASDCQQWALNAQEHSSMPRTVSEAVKKRGISCYDNFQSSILVAAIYDPYSPSNSRLFLAVESLVNDTATTQQHLSIAKLAQLAPLRALLAVSGESWILGRRVTSLEELASYMVTLQSWVAQMWSVQDENFTSPAIKALRLSSEILTKSLNSVQPFQTQFGNELDLFYAGLIIWAATAGASSRSTTSGSMIEPSRRSQASTSNSAEVDSPACLSRAHFLAPQQTESMVLESRGPLVPDQTAAISRFLSTVVEDVISLQVQACKTGCRSLLLCIETALRGYPPAPALSAQSNRRCNYSELITEALSQIKRMLDHDWATWGL